MRFLGEIGAATDRHDGERLFGRKDFAMARARVIGMAMGDERARHRPQRIDIEIASLAIEAGGGERETIGSSHDAAKISASCSDFEMLNGRIAERFPTLRNRHFVTGKPRPGGSQGNDPSGYRRGGGLR